MSTDRWINTEAVGHTYNKILLSREKECTWASSKEVDEPRAYYAEWSKSGRETQILCITHKYGIQRHGTDEPIHRAAVETQA